MVENDPGNALHGASDNSAANPSESLNPGGGERKQKFCSENEERK